MKRDPQLEMGIAPGGLIKQNILEDTYEADSWDRERTIIFNVQILDSESFQRVTGIQPAKTPISAQTYADLGRPYYKLHEETWSIKGDFGDLKSVKTIDKIKAQDEEDDPADEPSYPNPIIVLNPRCARLPFRPVSELTNEMKNMRGVQFSVGQ